MPLTPVKLHALHYACCLRPACNMAKFPNTVNGPVIETHATPTMPARPFRVMRTQKSRENPVRNQCALQQQMTVTDVEISEEIL